MTKHIISGLLMTLSANAHAHIGKHDDLSVSQVIHFLTQPEHLGLVIPGIIIVGLVVYYLVKNPAKSPDQ